MAYLSVSGRRRQIPFDRISYVIQNTHELLFADKHGTDKNRRTLLTFDALV